MKSYILKITKIFLLAILVPALTFAQADNERLIVESSPVIALVNARIIDGTGAQPLNDQTVIIRDGRIVVMGGSSSVEIPPDANQLMMKGKTLLPGWVLLHEHLYYPSTDKNHRTFVSQPIQFSRLYLAAGVTTARTAGSFEPYFDLRVKEAIESGTLVGPDYDLTAPYLEGRPGAVLQQNTLASKKEAVDMVNFWANEGFTSFKAYSHITREQLAEGIKAAHKQGLKFTGHLGGISYREAVDLGIDQIEHGFLGAGADVVSKDSADAVKVIPYKDWDPESKPSQSLFRHLIDNDVVIASTLEVLNRKTASAEKLPEDVFSLLTKSSRDQYQQEFHELIKPEREDVIRPLVNALMKFELAFWKAGGTLVVGTDPASVGTLPGYGSLRSIELLVDAGIPPLSVIKIATLNGAEAIGNAADRGSITIGKRADLIVVNGNPAENIHDIHKVEMVFKKGIGYDPIALKESAAGSIGGP